MPVWDPFIDGRLIGVNETRPNPPGKTAHGTPSGIEVTGTDRTTEAVKIIVISLFNFIIEI
ncbi:hypothetical protein KJ596_01810 [Patescibacteria group bacterium]|nr:hypothetical protein [Patescibacteria group bacterium]MBU1868201.1 hypothetical protein [Patescibacteria group bacterium]